MSHRNEKLSHLIKEEISLIFLHKLNNSSFGIITITNVKLSHDLKIANIYLSIFQKDKREEILEKIKTLTGMIRTELAHKIRIRYIPELKFFVDDTSDYVEKIDSLIKKIHENDNKNLE